jgi:hypothetical protein
MDVTELCDLSVMAWEVEGSVHGTRVFGPILTAAPPGAG